MLAVFPRRHPVMPLKLPVEIGQVGKAARRLGREVEKACE